MARTGDELRTAARTTDELADPAPEAVSLPDCYYSRLSQLHGACCYDGRRNRRTGRYIRETAQYVTDAESLAGHQTAGLPAHAGTEHDGSCNGFHEGRLEIANPANRPQVHQDVTKFAENSHHRDAPFRQSDQERKAGGT